MSESIAAEELRLLVERIERLSGERKGISDDIRDVFNEAASRGYDKAALREIIKKRAMDADKRRQREDAIETYQLALGL
ncbi:DUF2312 domain-containing protein [Stakelama pacifica]|uniref:Uncharacterized protein (UPF0335 family) n=1 Tax=Stakelama pacifica TaxID=517720 RepID=A0A4R6FKB1_9SPHN|nr:DUF2312 domain-containing protein [Stakelama pacifica]TDN81757.1 uncharacterized protein (UPF0335 family) [Stakelama pacifica]GGO96481.1 UPF0335 protein R02793 [Stakelama pacifica]